MIFARSISDSGPFHQDGYADAVFVRFSASRLAAAAAALSAVKAPRRVARQRSEALDFLRRDARAEQRGLRLGDPNVDLR